LPTRIVAPAGAGASHLARHLHRAGGFSKTPFVSFEARDALPTLEGLLAKGYTGTLVLDHLDGATPSSQAHLANLVRTHTEVFWIGTSRGPLESAMATALGVVSMTLPALKARVEDIASLTAFFLTQLGVSEPLSDSVRSAFERYDWPGNVVELEAVVRRAHSLGGLTLANLPRDIALRSASKRRRAGFHEEVLQFKTALVAETLARTSGNVSQAARDLGLQRTYLHRLMNELGVHAHRDAHALPPAEMARNDEATATRSSGIQSG
jgi:DNA-binding NtrC family response regulator